MGVACDLMGRISCGNLTLKGITREGFHDLIGDLMRSGITIEGITRRRITRERGRGRGRKERTHEKAIEEGDHTREGGRRRKGGRARESLEGLKFLRDTGGISVEKISLFFAGSHKIERKGFGSASQASIIRSAGVAVIIAFDRVLIKHFHEFVAQIEVDNVNPFFPSVCHPFYSNSFSFRGYF